MLVEATIGLAGTIPAESTLSFLGLGVLAPVPSWGAMLNDARFHLFDAPHTVVFPALAVMIAVRSCNLLGDAWSLPLTGPPRLPNGMFPLGTLPAVSVAITRAPGLCCVAIVKARYASLRLPGFCCPAFWLCAWGLLSATMLFGRAQRAQQTEPAKPALVQPGAPGKPGKTLPASTTGTLPPLAQADVEFMQGMIMHHAQAIEMTALIVSHTDNQELRLLGARISRSQSDEIKFMKRWLAARGEAVTMPSPPATTSSGTSSSAGHSEGAGATPGMDMSNMSHRAMGLMPGMLSPEQMEALGKAKGAEFDRLFLTGMIQHHNGALIMVKDLFDTAGAGQDAELFNFTTDVDTGQRAEIRIMQGMLEKKALEERR